MKIILFILIFIHSEVIYAFFPLPDGVNIIPIGKNAVKLRHISGEAVTLIKKENKLFINIFSRTNSLIEERKISKNSYIRTLYTSGIKHQEKYLFKGNQVYYYINNELINIYPQSLFSKGALTPCQRFETIDQFFIAYNDNNISNVVTKLTANLNNQWFKVDDSCGSNKKQIEIDTISSIQKGISCLINNGGNESIADALSLMGVLFLENKLHIKCVLPNEEYKTHIAGEVKCNQLKKQGLRI